MSDEVRALVARARRGDVAAFEALVRRYEARVRSIAYRVTGSDADADDVAQEAFVKAFRGLAAYAGRSEFYTWLYRITINTALNLRRKGRRRQEGEAAPPTPDAVPTPEAEVAGRRRREAIAAAVAQLSDPLRAALVLVAMEGLTYREAGEVLGVAEGTVAWRVHEARKKLKRSLGHMLPGGEDEEEDGLSRDARPAVELR